MPWERPTLSQLQAQIQADIDASPIGLTGWLRNAVAPILGWALAGIAYLHYNYQDYIAKNATPWGSTDEWLFGWAGLVGITQEDATAATGTWTMSGTGAAGSPLPSGTLLNSGGLQFRTTAAAAVDGTGALSVPVQCTTAGVVGNLATGTSMSLASPVGGINSAGTFTLGAPGADQETQDALKTRMLQRYASPPQGGALSDYVGWSMEVPGVTRAWALNGGAGAGTVVVYPMLDNTEGAYGGFPQGTDGVAAAETRGAPATGDQLTVANALFSKQPVTALVTVASPIKTPIDFTVTGPNAPTYQSEIEAALADMFVRLANVGGTLDPATMDAWPTIESNDWYAAIDAIAGIGNFDVTSPTGPLTPTTGQLYTVGTVTTST